MSRKKKPNGYWSKVRCQSEAYKYSSRSSFERGNGSAYNAARKNKWLDEICKHMTSVQKPHGYWTFCRCYKEAKRYNTSTEFQRSSSAAADAAYRQGFFKEICSHMVSPQAPKGYWTNERIIDLCASCNSFSELYRKSQYACILIKKRGLEKYTSHLVRDKGDANVVYMWRTEKTVGNKVLCKIGITSNRLGDARIRQVSESVGIGISSVVFMIKTRFARKKEAKLLSLGVEARGINGSGATEFRWMTEGEISQARRIVNAS